MFFKENKQLILKTKYCLNNAPILSISCNLIAKSIIVSENKQKIGIKKLKYAYKRTQEEKVLEEDIVQLRNYLGIIYHSL